MLPRNIVLNSHAKSKVWSAHYVGKDPLRGTNFDMKSTDTLAKQPAKKVRQHTSDVD